MAQVMNDLAQYFTLAHVQGNFFGSEFSALVNLRTQNYCNLAIQQLQQQIAVIPALQNQVAAIPALQNQVLVLQQQVNNLQNRDLMWDRRERALEQQMQVVDPNFLRRPNLPPRP
uniref:Uncharacterized protein n=1 Tax=Ditylenchus dipsaci TaxID=166011 RepID=A0A915DHA6_9BILA